MMYYQTKKGFVIVCDHYSKYFERNFGFVKSWKITIPKIQHIKNTKEPYGSISKKDFLDFLEQNIKEFSYQSKRLKKLREEINRCVRNE